MQYKLTGNLAFETPQNAQAARFYCDKLGITGATTDGVSIHVSSGPLHLYFDKQQTHSGPIFELLVPELEAAKEDLLSSGCSIVRWGGKGQPCYVKDPFGYVFNVFEDPSAFDPA